MKRSEVCERCGLTEDELQDNPLMQRIVWSQYLKAWAHYRCHVNAKFAKEQIVELTPQENGT